jgi:two-component system, OmpR family, sensor histidine kinase MtrB
VEHAAADGFVGQLPEPAFNQVQTQLLVADVVRLRRRVEELMELSRLDAGQEEVSVRAVDIVVVAQAIIDTRGWRDRVDVIGGPVTIANAVEHGGREMRVVVSAETAGVLIWVTDRGHGMPAEHLPRLFDRFYKADPARTGAGSGLGLAIARENAQLLGADLQVWSEIGVGTEVRLTLPVTQRLPDGEALVGQAGDSEAQSSIGKGSSLNASSSSP